MLLRLIFMRKAHSLTVEWKPSRLCRVSPSRCSTWACSVAFLDPGPESGGHMQRRHRDPL